MKSYKIRAKLIDTKFISVWVDADSEEDALNSLGDENFDWDNIKDEDYYTHEFEDAKIETELWDGKLIHRDMQQCKFCKEFDYSTYLHTHQGEFVCSNCWDERLRCTE